MGAGRLEATTHLIGISYATCSVVRVGRLNIAALRRHRGAAI